MIMYTLHASQHFAPELVNAPEALGIIRDMVEDGVTVHTVDFYSPNHEHVILFWTTDGEGQTATLWEYTMHFLPTVPATGEVRQVMRTEYAVQDAELASRTGTEDAYAVGE